MSQLRHFIGLMSGTSADAIDAALVGFESDGTTHLVCTHTLELPADLKARIIAAQTRVDTTIRDICEQDVALSLLYAAAVKTLLEKANISASEIEAIGNHGQTLLHAPEADHAFTLQIGDNHRLAELLGITVVGDFRRRDIAAGAKARHWFPHFTGRWFLRLKRQPSSMWAVLPISVSLLPTKLAVLIRVRGIPCPMPGFANTSNKLSMRVVHGRALAR